VGREIKMEEESRLNVKERERVEKKSVVLKMEIRREEEISFEVKKREDGSRGSN
jgi:hypothetical protein